MKLGSSKTWSKTAGCGCMNVKEGDTSVQPLDEDCNCIYMPYGDGASFSGYRPDPWPVPGTQTAEKPDGETLTFRGIKNFDATIDWAMKHGLDKATEFVLTGGSAVRAMAGRFPTRCWDGLLRAWTNAGRCRCRCAGWAVHLLTHGQGGCEAEEGGPDLQEDHRRAGSGVRCCVPVAMRANPEP
jgi:hypothetical protein